MWHLRSGVVCAVICMISADSEAQYYSYRPVPRDTANYRTGADVSYSRGPTQRRPRNYDYYYYSQGAQPYYVTPMPAPAMQQGPVILGPVRPYTDEEYARLVLASMSVPSVQPATRKAARSILVAEETEGPTTREYKRAETRVTEVLDRGIMLVDTREEVRLRGVRMLSETDADEVYRYYAREGIRTLREATAVGNVFIDFENPVRDSDGTLLGIVYLPDGTELNRLILASGLGQLEPRDFEDDRDIGDLVDAERMARQSKLGLWSNR